MALRSSCKTMLYVFTLFSLLVGHLVSLTDGKCGGVKLTGKTGDIHTPNYPNPYPSHSRCSWLIQVPVGYKIKLQFYHFVLESTYECGSDVMKIYDGRNSSATLLGKYCQAMNPFKVESTGMSLLVVFRSDRSLNYRGFKATYTAIPIETVKEMSFRRTLKNFTVVLGKEVKFHCQINDGSVNIEFVWTKHGKILVGSGPDYSIRSNTANKRSHLLLRKVTTSDAGVYGCLVNDYDMGKNLSSYGTLQVKVPAAVTEGPSSMNVNVGDNVVLQCGVIGDPAPKISWHVNGQDKTSLAIRTNLTSELNLEVTKTAVVNCTADNGIGVDWKTARITALSPPTEKVTEFLPTLSEQKWFSPVIVMPPNNVTAELGDNVTLACAANGNPKPTIRWLLDERKYYENMPEDENGVSYFTFTLTKNKMTIRCEAQNKKDIDTRTAYATTVAQVEAVRDADQSEGFFGGPMFFLILAFIALLILVIVGVMFIIFRRRNLKLQNLSSPVDVEKLQSNPIFQKATNYYIDPKLLGWEVPRCRMEFIKELGHGNGKFSSLFLGKISQVGADECEKVSLVMVKLLKEEHISETERENFEKDAIALTTFSHPYVQSLFGVCVDHYPLCLVFEFSESDESLHQFLVESGRGHCSLHRQTDMSNAKPKLSNVDQISISKQIANGMEYLAGKGYVHRELCTKNCIIGKGMVVKISNLGFFWKGPNCDYYSLEIHERALYPVRWLPIESIHFGIFSEDSDIWSFGVLLWEIYSSGVTPYYGMNDEEVISLVSEGDILPCPKECPKEMYEVMQGCWNMDPQERPRFRSIHQRISSLFNGVPV